MSASRTPSHVALTAGGGALNAASMLAKVGHRACLACTVGDDRVGRALLARASKAGVDVRYAKLARPRTGIAFIELDRAGGRQVVAYRSREEALPAWPAGKFAAVLASGVTPAWRFAEQARRARASGALVAVDLNARLGIFRDRSSRACLGLLRAAHVVKASTDDLDVLGLDLEDLRSKSSRGALVVLTAGAKPARAVGPFGVLSVDVPRPLRGADPTGAGDAFFAGLVHAQLGDPRAALDRGRAAEAIGRGHAIARTKLAEAPQMTNGARPKPRAERVLRAEISPWRRR